MNQIAGITAVLIVSVLTIAIGTWGLRFSRTTSDFFVASRTVRPALNASAIGGEYLSAGSFLGVAGLVLVFGGPMLWYPVGWTAGYLVLLVLVAAPLRRSGAYTLSDFAGARLASQKVRRLTSMLVVVIAWLYLIPQFQAAGITLELAAGLDPWVGELVVAVVVLINVLAGGMRSITFVQAFQFWLKLTALLVPACFLLLVWWGDGATSPAATPGGEAWASPIVPGPHALYATYSLIAATFLGTMGLPHVVVRFYTNPDGRAARRTTLVVLGLLGLFYVLPPIYGALGRLYASDLVASGASDIVVLELPSRMVGGVGGDLLSALLVAGAFAAFLSTSSGLTVALSGVLAQDVLSRWTTGIQGFRLAAVLGIVGALGLGQLTVDVGVATAVGLAFAVTASTFAPLLVLGIWWSGLTDVGALAGLTVGGLSTGVAVVSTFLGGAEPGWTATLLAQPAAWSVPLSTITMVGISLLTPSRKPPHVGRFLVRLHTPESVHLDRG